MTWYAPTWREQHSCRSANTPISTSLLILPWFWCSSTCCFSFMGHLGGQGQGDSAGSQPGKAAVPFVFTCLDQIILYRLWGLCVLFSCWSPDLFLLLSENKTAQTQDWKNWRWFVALALCFPPIFVSLFLFSFLYHLCWGRSKSKWYKQSPHKVLFLSLIVL